MPYIKNEFRKELDSEVETLGQAILKLYQSGCGGRDGLMNYAITRLLLQIYPKDKENYHDYNEALGALEACKLEYYRRAISPYEEMKRFENGDVYPNPIQP
jgi:hypothetical protein